MNSELSGKVIAVTGGFGILGMATALTVANYGAKVVLIDSAPSPTDKLPASLNDALLLGGVDLASEDAAKQAIAETAAKYGELTGLVNVAGTFRWATLQEDELDTWDFLFRVNLKTAATASKAALPLLTAQKSARIINIGAGAGNKAAAGMGPYAASKAAVARLTEALAEEFKESGLTVNAVLPSVIDTPRNRTDMPGADASRWVKPEAIADVIAFLLSPRADAINGALIPVFGRV
ncbi:SDR family NAD(P)-dependent oxidoreductase [Paraburkholderia acidicola]|uniref:SDR family NAD(P)-dependent oxidoreductase n=1 Tax=Paraburkholderia acidicola TaxID=1912599 RepID=A0ABV1LLV6_9BURK